MFWKVITVLLSAVSTTSFAAKRLSFTLAACFIYSLSALISIGALPEGSPYVPQGAVIRFDEDTYLQFEDVGRVEQPSAIRFGRAITLHVTHRGETKTIRNIPTEVAADFYLTSKIFKIAFADEDHVWVLSSLSRRFSGGVLIDLRSSSLKKRFKGQDITLSADGRHVAYSFQLPKVGAAVFIDDAMVYPNYEPGFVHAGVVEPEKENGQTASELAIPKGSFYDVNLLAPLKWNNSNDLEFLIQEPVAATSADDSQTTNPEKVIRLFALRNLRSVDQTVTGTLKTEVLEPSAADARSRDMLTERAAFEKATSGVVEINQVVP